MTRSERLSPVLKIAETKKRNAARVVAQANQKLLDYQRKLEDLRKFRNEYSHFGHNDGQVLTANQLQDRQKFIHQLDEGIKILTTRVESQIQNSDLEKQAWLEAHKHSDAIDRLMGKMKKVETEIQQTRVDNELDERAQYSKPRYQAAPPGLRRIMPGGRNNKIK